MITVDCKITNFSLYLFVYFFGNYYNIGELTSATSKERMTTNIIFVRATPINLPVSFVFVYAYPLHSIMDIEEYEKYLFFLLWKCV